MQRAREAAVIVQAESDTGKASMHDAGGRGAQTELSLSFAILWLCYILHLGN